MKTIILMLFILYLSAGASYNHVIIGGILYKMPIDEISKIKSNYNIQESEIIEFKFEDNSCFVKKAEWIKLGNVNMEEKLRWKEFIVETTPLFLLEDKFVDMDYILPGDIKSLATMPTDEAIAKYHCKGLNLIFVVQLHEGKKLQDKPVGGIVMKKR